MPEGLRTASPRLADLVADAGVAEVRARLGSYAEHQAATAGRTDPQLAAIWGFVGETLSGGKLVRPAILLAVVRAVCPDGEWQRERAVELAVAVELLHHAFLLHDDVIDHDSQRRGRPNLIARVAEATDAGDEAQRRHLGEAAAILAGDLVLAEAHQRVARLDVPYLMRLRLLGALEETLSHSVSGEVADVRYSLPGPRPSLAAVLAMSASKTGAYTVRLPLLWALIATDSEVPRCVEEFAHVLGLAFQLQDDLLGLFGDPAAVGKDPVSDIREGKFTAVMAYARESEQWAVIEPQLGNADITPEEGIAVLEALEASGARLAVERDLAEALASARRLAGEAGVLADVLNALVLSLTERRS